MAYYRDIRYISDLRNNRASSYTAAANMNTVQMAATGPRCEYYDNSSRFAPDDELDKTRVTLERLKISWQKIEMAKVSYQDAPVESTCASSFETRYNRYLRDDRFEAFKARTEDELNRIHYALERPASRNQPMIKPSQLYQQPPIQPSIQPPIQPLQAARTYMCFENDGLDRIPLRLGGASRIPLRLGGSSICRDQAMVSTALYYPQETVKPTVGAKKPMTFEKYYDRYFAPFDNEDCWFQPDGTRMPTTGGNNFTKSKYRDLQVVGNDPDVISQVEADELDRIPLQLGGLSESIKQATVPPAVSYQQYQNITKSTYRDLQVVGNRVDYDDDDDDGNDPADDEVSSQGELGNGYHHAEHEETGPEVSEWNGEYDDGGCPIGDPSWDEYYEEYYAPYDD